MANEAYFIAVQSGLVALGEGEPGTGKTRTVEAFCRALNRHFECLILSQHDPAEVTGFPHVVDISLPSSKNADGTWRFSQNKGLEYLKPGYRQRCESAPNGGFLFIDEMGDAPPACQAAALQLLNDGIPNTIIAAAGNPPDCSTNAHELAPATVNRLCVLDWESPLDDWSVAALSGFPDPKFPILPESWEAGIPQEMSLIVSFLRHRPSLFQQLPEHASQRGRPWPSKRSWTNSARLLAAAKSVGAGDETQSKLVAGCVGPAANEFLTWRNALDLPNPEDLLRDPKSYKHEERGDKCFAILSSVTAAVLGRNTPDRWLASMEVFAAAAQNSVDLVAVCIRPLLQHKPKESVVAVPASLCNRLMPILRDAIV